jgi:signal transduction histidine kinase
MVWSVLWGLAVGAAAWLAAAHEVDELLDETLQSSSELLMAMGDSLPLRRAADPAAAPWVVPVSTRNELRHFAWQMVTTDGVLLARSASAPTAPWHTTPSPGLTEVTGWRIHGVAATQGTHMLYVGQAHEERLEARLEVTLAAALSAMAVGILGYLWLRHRVRAELEPLQRLSRRLADVDWQRTPVDPALGSAEREELQPMVQAIEDLARRLSERLLAEQAFSAHAAHALRTPLAGIDAQLAVALRESPPALGDRLQRIRGGVSRLQAVVAALLGLFRSDGELQRRPIELKRLLDRLPMPGLAVEVEQTGQLLGDEDLLAAALLNLLDNAVRHGARGVRLSTPRDQQLELHDDGPGIDAQRRQGLSAALHAQAYAGNMGLGLMLADRVARVHGGRLELPATATGFVARLDLGALPPGSSADQAHAPSARSSDAAAWSGPGRGD